MISVATGLIMVFVFRYSSDQKAVRIAKDRLKAHLLALRLYQDQIHVVLQTYGRIVLGTLHYLRLALTPLLVVIVPMTFLIAQLDHYFGSAPITVGQPFLVIAQIANSDGLNEVSLTLPEGLQATAPAVHVPSENKVVWRMVAKQPGDYFASVGLSSQMFSKRVRVGSGLLRLSPARWQGNFWRRMLFSAEPALPENNVVEAIEVQYPARRIAFAGLQWDWIWLFFVLSLISGFLFKSVFGIEI
jgi:hypothetical protein